MGKILIDRHFFVEVGVMHSLNLTFQTASQNSQREEIHLPAQLVGATSRSPLRFGFEFFFARCMVLRVRRELCYNADIRG